MSVRIAILALVLVLSGCAQPSKQYINADTYGMYFALPRESAKQKMLAVDRERNLIVAR